MLSWNIVSDWIELYIYIIFNISSVLKVNRVALKKCCDDLNLAIIKIIIAILVSILGQTIHKPRDQGFFLPLILN